MPIVTIESWPLPPQSKPELIQKIANIFTEWGVPPEAVTIIIHETQLENWGSAGEQHSRKIFKK